jgi:hypothetical protein
VQADRIAFDDAAGAQREMVQRLDELRIEQSSQNVHLAS